MSFDPIDLCTTIMFLKKEPCVARMKVELDELTRVFGRAHPGQDKTSVATAKSKAKKTKGTKRKASVFRPNRPPGAFILKHKLHSIEEQGNRGKVDNACPKFDRQTRLPRVTIQFNFVQT